MITIGLDPHPDSHTVAALDENGAALTSLAVANNAEGLLKLHQFALAFPDHRWAIEGAANRFILPFVRELLDPGGESAVTIRAVAQAVGMSHNAPYKHFEDRSALLRAVAVQDFAALGDAFVEIRRLEVEPLTKLKRALTVFVAYGEKYPARYRLLFSDPDIADTVDVAVQGGDLEAAAMRSFAEFAAIVQGCQNAGDLPDMPNAEQTGLIYASVHGLIDLQMGGRMRQEKGLTDAYKGAERLVDLLQPLRDSRG